VLHETQARFIDQKLAMGIGMPPNGHFHALGNWFSAITLLAIQSMA